MGESAALARESSSATALRLAAEVENGDWSEAIEVLASANRAARDDDLEIALAGLRHRGAQRLLAAGVPSAPLQPGESAPVGESGLPEVGLAELTAPALRGSILEHGCLLVRGVLDPAEVGALSAAIDESFAARDEWAAATGTHDDDRYDVDAPGVTTSSWWSRLEVHGRAKLLLRRMWVRDASGLLLGDSPRALARLLDLYDALGLRAVAAEYLGGRPVLSTNKCTLRRVAPDRTGNWHQDGAFLGDGVRALNLWLPLTACGVDSPGLDIVARRFDQIVETGTDGSYFGWAVGDGLAEDTAGPGGIVRPHFDAGDLLFFDDLLLHRTASAPGMTVERHAVEFWCFAASAYPEGHVPLVW